MRPVKSVQGPLPVGPDTLTLVVVQTVQSAQYRGEPGRNAERENSHYSGDRGTKRCIRAALLHCSPYCAEDPEQPGSRDKRDLLASTEARCDEGQNGNGQ